MKVTTFVAPGAGEVINGLLLPETPEFEGDVI